MLTCISMTFHGCVLWAPSKVNQHSVDACFGLNQDSPVCRFVNQKQNAVRDSGSFQEKLEAKSAAADQALGFGGKNRSAEHLVTQLFSLSRLLGGCEQHLW